MRWQGRVEKFLGTIGGNIEEGKKGGQGDTREKGASTDETIASHVRRTILKTMMKAAVKRMDGATNRSSSRYALLKIRGHRAQIPR